MTLSQRINNQFRVTNAGLTTNTQVYFDAHGGWHLHRYRAGETDDDPAAVGLLYPASRVISPREVLLQVDRLTGFLAFWSGSFIRVLPTNRPSPMRSCCWQP